MANQSGANFKEPAAPAAMSSTPAAAAAPATAPAAAATDSIPPGSPLPAGTSARYSGCLASASRPGSGRRCPPATVAAPLASSLDFLQGTFEKIHLQHLLRQQALQLMDLLAQRRFLPGRQSRLRFRLRRTQLTMPQVQRSSTDPQFSGQRCHTLAALHPIHRHLRNPREYRLTSNSFRCRV